MKKDNKLMKITVITVTYNAEETIEYTIKSVLNQRIKGLEYFIIDGESTDKTVEIARKYEDAGVKVISEKDTGIYNAMNRGIALASGGIISFMNAGDSYVENGISDALKYFNEGVDIVVGKAIRTVDGVEAGHVFDVDEKEIWRLHITNIFCHQAMFIRRNVFDKIGSYDEKYKILADYEWNLRAYIKGMSIKLINEEVCVYDTGGVSATLDIAEECKEIAQKYDDGSYRGAIEDIYIKRKRTKDLEDQEICLNYDQVIIYGAGGYGIKFFNILKSKGIKILYFVDKFQAGSKLCGIDVKECNEENITKYIDNNPETAIFISSIKYEDEIRKNLERLKVDKNKVFSVMDVR